MKTPAVISLFAAAVAAGIFVWPTPYLLVADGAVVKRINRLTGVEEYSSSQGWIRDSAEFSGVRAQDVTSQIKVDESVIEPESPMGEVVVYNPGASLSGVHLQFSLLDANDVVVGTTTADVGRIEKGDRNRIQVDATMHSGSVAKLRLDRATASGSPGATVASR